MKRTIGDGVLCFQYDAENRVPKGSETLEIRKGTVYQSWNRKYC